MLNICQDEWADLGFILASNMSFLCLARLILYDAQCGEKTIMAYVNGDGQNERAHPCSMIWAFSVRQHKLQYPLIL